MKLTLDHSTVRTWRESDAESVAQYANNRKIWLNLRDGFPFPYTKRDAVDFIQRCRKMKNETMFAIEIDQQAVGSIGFTIKTDIERISAEIGYWLGEPFWNRGNMTAVLKAVTEYAIDRFELLRVFALPFTTNFPSIRALEKAGYIREGELIHSAIKNSEIKNQYMYAFIADDLSAYTE